MTTIKLLNRPAVINLISIQRSVSVLGRNNKHDRTQFFEISLTQSRTMYFTVSKHQEKPIIECLSSHHHFAFVLLRFRARHGKPTRKTSRQNDSQNLPLVITVVSARENSHGHL
jgi:hypothetical protein